jgi:hypothetical protein
MDIVNNTLLFLHFIGLARLIGGGLSQVSNAQKHINQGMFDGALTQLLTGFALYYLDFKEANHMVVGIKILVLLVILVLVVGNRRKTEISSGVYWAINGGAIFNVALAVFAGVVKAV